LQRRESDTEKEFAMRIKSFFLFMFMLLAACSPQAARIPDPAEPTNSGIVGHVTLGPACPVVRAEDPCPDKPYQATLTILSADGKTKIFQFQTGSDGYFKVSVDPGQYILHPESPNVMPHANDMPFTVKAEQYTQVNVVYDSGIR
jgi:hypothetical protein